VIRYNGVEIEETFAEMLPIVEISPAKPLFLCARGDDMDEVKSNVCYECKKCIAKGTLIENVESIDLNEIKKLPCGCPAENGVFQIFHYRLHKG